MGDATITLKETPAFLLEEETPINAGDIEQPEGGRPVPEPSPDGDNPQPPAPDVPVTDDPAPGPPITEKDEGHDDPFLKRFGRSAEEIEAMINESAALRGRTFVEDSSKLLADEAEEKLVQAWRAGGWQELTKYYEAMSTDWGKVADDDIVRDDVLRKVGKDAPKFMFERAYRTKLEELGFSEELEPGTPGYEEHRKAVAWAAKNIRDARIAEQQSYKLPEVQKPPKPDHAVDFERQKQEIMATPAVRQFLTEKAINIDGFRYEVNAESVLDLVFDQNKLNSLFTKPDGTPDDAKLFRWYALALDMDKPFSLHASSKVAQAKQDWVKSQINAREANPDPAPKKNGWSVEWAK